MSEPLIKWPKLNRDRLDQAYLRMLTQIAWVIAPFSVQQILRLGTNIILARLLAPNVFGLMLLVNTIRTGAELLSDIGIGQSVVRSRNGMDMRFLNVAWTLQVARGGALTLLMLCAAAPIAVLYGRPELLSVSLAISPVFLLSGLASPAAFLMQKRMELRKRAVYELVCILFQCAVTVVLAYYIRSVWALVGGLVISVAFSSLASFFLDLSIRPKLSWDAIYGAEILRFGRWIFLSTVVYFAASSFDRAYFVAVMSLSLAGVYGISRTYSDIITQLAQRAGAFLVFPRIAALEEPRSSVAPRLRSRRSEILSVVAIGTGLAISMADKFVLLAYDPRYQAAAFMVPCLLMAAWFAVLSSFADAMLMGGGRPAPGAIANGAKFGVLLLGLPVAVFYGSILSALVTLILAEVVRWLWLLPASRSEQFMRVSDDVFLTGIMICTALAAKFLLASAGLVPSWAQWWQMKALAQL